MILSNCEILTQWPNLKTMGETLKLFKIIWKLYCTISNIYIVTARKRSLRRLCFYTCLSVHWGGVPGQVHSRAGTPPGRYTPRADTPPWAGTPPTTVHAGIRSISGRYASHWNVFLFVGLLLSHGTSWWFVKDFTKRRL